jgi:transcriptional antiterminator RfaH
MNWYAIYTKPKQEDEVAVRLQAQEIEALNPKSRFKKYRGGRLTEVIDPFFPCYVFAKFDRNNNFRLVKYTKGVRYVVGKNNPIAVPDAIITTIKENMQEDNVVFVRPDTFEKGVRVKIKDGAFKDFGGIFERTTKGFERVIILLDAICYRLEISACSLVKV